MQEDTEVLKALWRREDYAGESRSCSARMALRMAMHFVASFHSKHEFLRPACKLNITALRNKWIAGCRTQALRCSCVHVHCHCMQPMMRALICCHVCHEVFPSASCAALSRLTAKCHVHGCSAPDSGVRAAGHVLRAAAGASAWRPAHRLHHGHPGVKMSTLRHVCGSPCWHLE